MQLTTAKNFQLIKCKNISLRLDPACPGTFAGCFLLHLQKVTLRKANTGVKLWGDEGSSLAYIRAKAESHSLVSE